MRRSRITYAPFAAGLLAGLIAALWFVFDLAPGSPKVQPFVPETGMPTVGEAPDFGEAEPPRALTITPPPADQPLVWLPSSVETAGMPDERARLRRTEVIPLDELYPNNRLILRHVRIDAQGSGMQISGEVLTDFFADRSPAWLPSGALLGFKISIELYQHDVVLVRDGRGTLRTPHIDPRLRGLLVPSQSTETTIMKPHGEFATAPFALPVLKKPLAPGVYSLVAVLRFRTQAEPLQDAIKWCSDLYGARVEQDADTLELTYKSILTHPQLHDEVYSDLVNRIGQVSDRVRIDIGALVNGNTVQLRGPGANVANILLEDLHCTVAAQVRDYAHQLDNVDAVINETLESKLKIMPKRDANQQEREKFNKLKEKWKENAEEEKRRIKRDNKGLIYKHGGRLSAEESAMLELFAAAQPQVLQQITDFQDRLARNYWVLCDGVLQYTGWWAMYTPGYDVCEAITNGRLPGLVAAPNPAELAEKWQLMEYRWRYVPADLRAPAFAHLRRKEETNDLHPRRFAFYKDKGYHFDTRAWADWRTEWQAALDLALDDWRTVDTTRTYATQAWPKAFGNAKAMYAELLLLPWTWEHYIRVEMQRENADKVTADWPPEIAKQAATTPGARRTAFESASMQAKAFAGTGDFISRYAKAVEARAKRPGED